MNGVRIAIGVGVAAVLSAHVAAAADPPKAPASPPPASAPAASPRPSTPAVAPPRAAASTRTPTVAADAASADARDRDRAAMAALTSSAASAPSATTDALLASASASAAAPSAPLVGLAGTGTIGARARVVPSVAAPSAPVPSAPPATDSASVRAALARATNVVDLAGAASSASSGGASATLTSGGTAPVDASDVRLTKIAGRTNADATAATAGERREDGAPQPGASVSAALPPVEHKSDAERVIAMLRPSFRVCYERGAEIEPRMSGKAVLDVRIDGDGVVRETGIASNTGLSDGVVACVASRLRAARFSIANGKPMFVQVPVTFVRQKP